MPKHYGEPYDPALRKTEVGSKLYTMWKKVRKNPHCKEFENFPNFYAWAVCNGYTVGDRLILIDESMPYCPDNCDWAIKPGEWTHEWNRAVNRIRKHYGMESLEGTNYGD